MVSVGVVAEEDISPDPGEVCPSAYPADHSYEEEVEGNQEGSFRAVELGKLAAATVAVSELVVVGKLLQRPSQVLRLKRGP